jgi:predicted dehydrogenase/sugar phosphate isomerase/epimerase
MQLFDLNSTYPESSAFLSSEEMWIDNRNIVKQRIGCSTITYCHLRLEGALQKIAEHGFTAIDIGVHPLNYPHINPLKWTQKNTEALVRQLKELNLRVSSLNVDPSGLAARYRDEPLEYIESLFVIARELGAYTVTVPPGPSVKEKDWLEIAKSAVPNFKRLAETAEAQGIRLTIEAPYTNTLAGNYEQSCRLFELIGDPRIGCTFDTSHAQRNDPRPIVQGIASLGAPILHVHLRDAFWKDGSLTPGKGGCDYMPFIERLIKNGYLGDFNLELESTHTDTDQEIDYAKNYIETIIDGKDLPEEFARWKDHKAQFRRAMISILKNPRSFLAAQPFLKRMYKPLKDRIPQFFIRYEMGWRRRFIINGSNEISPKKARHISYATDKTVRVAILGCGKIGFKMFSGGFARLPNVELVGVADIDHDAAKKTAHKLRCVPYYSVEDLIHKPKPNLVVNSTKEWAHYDTTMQLLNNGIDVFCEKIMADSLEHGERMVRCAAEKERVLSVNYNWRYLPGIAKIRQIKESRTLGELYVLRFFCHSWAWNHVLDLVDFLGGKATSVSAITRQRDEYLIKNSWYRFADEILYIPDLYALATLETAEGVGATITCSSNLWEPESCLFNLDAVFQKGIITLSGIRTYDALGLISCSEKHIDIKQGMSPKDGPNTFAITWQRSIENFMDAYMRGKPVPTSGEQGLRVMKMEHAIVQSAKSGRKILLD